DPNRASFIGLWSASRDSVTEVRYIDLDCDVKAHTVQYSKDGRNLTVATVRYLKVDLTRPLEPYFAQAKRHFMSMQRDLIKHGAIDRGARGRAQSGEIYQRYLRALDALDMHGKPPRGLIGKLGVALFPHDTNTASRREKVR